MSNEIIITQKEIESKIYSIRNVQVMLDSDLAEIYQSETKYINRATKRNPDRFPENFAFQLSKDEWDSLRLQSGTLKNENLKFQIGTSSSHGGRRTKPFVYTEQGVAMLSEYK